MPYHKRPKIDRKKFPLPQWGRKMVRRAARAILRRAIEDVFTERQRLTLPEFAERFVVLSPDSARGGEKYSFAAAPYAREISEVLSSRKSHHRIVAVKKAAQTTLTQTAINLVAHTIHSDPRPIIFYQETEDKMRETLRMRIRPLLQEACFEGLVGEQGARKGNNTLKNVMYGGGCLYMRGSNSKVSFSSTPAGVIILDEFSRFANNIAGEGDPLSLARQRGITYGDRLKVYVPTTPVSDEEGEGTFATLYLSGDQREYFIPCWGNRDAGGCGEMDFTRLDRFVVRLEENPETGDDLPRGYLRCKHCKYEMDEAEKRVAVQRGEWRATAKRSDAEVTSYNVPGFLSMFESLDSIANKKLNVDRGEASRQAFMNVVVGDFYTPSSVPAPTTEEAKRHVNPQRERGVVPQDADYLVMSIDLQRGEKGGRPWVKYKVEACCKGWFGVVECRRVEDVSILNAAGRSKLDELIRTQYVKPDGELIPVRITGIDCGDGVSSRQATLFTQRYTQPTVSKHGSVQVPHRSRKPCVIALKGSSNLQPTKMIWRQGETTGKGKSKTRQSKDERDAPLLWWIGGPLCAEELYRALGQLPPKDKDDIPHGRIEFPTGMPRDYYEELVCKSTVTELDKTGNAYIRFSEPRGRDEAHDLAVYCRALADLCGWEKKGKNRKGAMDTEPATPPAKPTGPPPPSAPATPAAPPTKVPHPRKPTKHSVNASRRRCPPSVVCSIAPYRRN